jgi:hypothetical protein
MDRTGKVNGSYKRLRTAQAAESIAKESSPLPAGPFRVIVIDPPWQYDNRPEDPSHRAAEWARAAAGPWWRVRTA